MQTYLKIFISVFIFVLVGSCEREDVFELPAPGITLINDGPDHITQEAGKEVYLEMKLQAARGLSQFSIYLNDEIYQNITYEKSSVTEDYNFIYTIPFDAQNGQELEFRFELHDATGASTAYTYTVKVDATFSEVLEQVNGIDVITIKGRLNSNYVIARDKTYRIDSTLSIESNSTLTVEKGSTVYFKTHEDPGQVSRLVITRGSQIKAIGTAEEPIVFTSDKILTGEEPGPADWGGIWIFGGAPTNEGSDILRDGFRYGGRRPDESSGTLRFVRAEYSGKDGAHAFHFFGLGSQTQVDHIQAYRSENTAFKVHGGRVNLRYIAGTGHGGYGIWAEYGWQGNGQFWLFHTDRQATLVPLNFWNQARSIEMRNDESFFLKEPRTTFRIANVTLTGNGYDPDQNLGTRRGLRVRRGAHGIIQNAIVTQFPNDGVRVEDLEVSELGSTMILGNTRAYGNQNNYEHEAKSFFLENPEYNVGTDPVAGISVEDFVGSAPSTFNPPSISNWFEPADYIGAVKDEANDWTAEGIWFKNLDGTIR